MDIRISAYPAEWRGEKTARQVGFKLAAWGNSLLRSEGEKITPGMRLEKTLECPGSGVGEARRDAGGGRGKSGEEGWG